ncbi:MULTISPECIES: LysE family transporter [Pantoea]|jgi:L-lysine exporter family protein LysE/ArgO|uniref:LysE family transporter n=1 Tax=Pantoea brenneri TaxID=472694 RepID=A0A653YR36_9GAMM|nr:MULTISPECIES: LysE family transporter [Pantoea]MBZ6396893.1 LysE family translocator [Pantoea sp.]MBZ6440113.1 LysE family translocator [Pantoea sp.]MDH1088417.1 LysE family translocator [Pantoea brenneri]MDU4129920.1 LysE family transporter [Pantoea sp.]MDU7865595.1 LysE family transporter [Pantoea sp.]
MIEFSNGFLLSLSLCLDIGIANIAMITLAMQRGYFHGFWLGMGTCVGDLAYALLALAGMAVLLQYEAVRWILWIGGGAMLLWFAGKMLMAAFRKVSELNVSETHQYRPLLREFGRGVVLAMSSPTAILWFATVGGALISRMGQHSVTATSWFLSGFFIAGMFWTCVLCLVGSFGGKLLGQRLLKYSYIASALIFSYFALYVIVSGYREFMVT